MRFVDPEGTSTYVTRLDDGTYQVFGGNLNDNNLGIYVVEMVDGKYYIEDVPIGYTATMYSFYNSDIGGIDGWRKDAIIDPNDPMGSSFLEEIESGVTLFEYIDKARTGKVWDVKITNNTENVIVNINIYRGHRQWLSEYGKMNEKNYYAF